MSKAQRGTDHHERVWDLMPLLHYRWVMPTAVGKERVDATAGTGCLPAAHWGDWHEGK